MSVIAEYPWIAPLVQRDTLTRFIHDPLTPLQLHRLAAIPERWEAHAGDTQTFSKAALKPAVVTPRPAGQDPEPEHNKYEQWRVEAHAYNGTTDIDMQVARGGIVPLNLQQVKEEVERAGRSISRVARNKLFSRYLGGHAIVESVIDDGSNTTVVVNSVAGWSDVLRENGQLVNTSLTDAKIYEVNGDAPSVASSRVVGVVPDYPLLYPDGPGKLILSGLPTIAPLDVLTAFDRPLVIYSGGGKSSDDITTAHTLTLDDLQRATAHLRDDSNSVHPQGGCFYGHIAPLAEQGVFRDNAMQRANEGRFDGVPYLHLAVGYHAGTMFYTNNENPALGTIGKKHKGTGPRTKAIAGPEFGGDVVNRNGVKLTYTIITAAGSLYEKYIDERELLADSGLTGRAGGMQVTSNSVQIVTDRIQFILRSPLDRLQRKWSFTWAWDGDFGVPSDQRGGQNDGDGTTVGDWTRRFKRAAVIVSAVPT